MVIFPFEIHHFKGKYFLLVPIAQNFTYLWWLFGHFQHHWSQGEFMIKGELRRCKPNIFKILMITVSVFHRTAMKASPFDLTSGVSNGWHWPCFTSSCFSLRLNVQCFITSVLSRLAVLFHRSLNILYSVSELVL